MSSEGAVHENGVDQGGVRSSQQDIMEFSNLLGSADSFFQGLLADKAALAAELAERRARRAVTAEQAEAKKLRLQAVQADIEAKKAELKRWQEETETLRNQYEEIKATVQERQIHLRELEASLPDVPATDRDSSSKEPSVNGPPFILVLIDASNAPFNEEAIRQGEIGGRDMGERVRWEVEKDLREHNIELEDEDEEPGVQPAVLTYVWHNRKALVFNLQQNKVIRSEDTWDRFLEGFMSNPSNQVMDTDSHPIDQFMARMIRTFGRCKSLKRIYLAGIHLETLYEACPEIRPQKADPFFIRVGPKMVLINHRETDDQREVLLSFGARVATFLRFFSSDNGLGADLGWAFRASTPPVGPGDQNHEEGDDDNGYGQVYEKRGFSGGGAWNKGGLGTPKSQMSGTSRRR
ncbi:hypothetical protein C6P46_004308 [Rhodotorula mucilaginosa]|uniref:DUF7923 domain-containing protein n=1 Tax=Rhodotorula mucilaginosa TaxID=5537 RepID=A0A9P6W989_RHOMI|nr:hypothetical protein C6P46_004308 [Rhodotorula mucilaginosa]TKA54971.1 hypothetical protein B0A53_02444 [Rhodotorula sp. CCFEE 5036]